MLAMMSGLFFYHRSEKMTQDKFCIFGFDHSSNPHASQLQYGFKVTRVCVNFDQCWDVSPLEVGLAPKESLTFFFPSWVLSLDSMFLFNLSISSLSCVEFKFKWRERETRHREHGPFRLDFVCPC